MHDFDYMNFLSPSRVWILLLLKVIPTISRDQCRPTDMLPFTVGTSQDWEQVVNSGFLHQGKGKDLSSLEQTQFQIWILEYKDQLQCHLQDNILKGFGSVLQDAMCVLHQQPIYGHVFPISQNTWERIGLEIRRWKWVRLLSLLKLSFCRNLVSFPCHFKLRWLEILVLSLRVLLYEDIGISQLPPSSGAQAREFRDPDICTVTPTFQKFDFQLHRNPPLNL